MKRSLQISSLFFLAFLMAGCATKAYVIHPGAANLFDSQAYDTLYIAHAAIEQTKTNIVGNAFGSETPTVKTVLNALIRSYNVAQASYLAYHTAAISGTATTAQVTDLQSKLVDVTNSMGNLTATTGGK